jgi:hypothetical protein
MGSISTKKEQSYVWGSAYFRIFYTLSFPRIDGSTFYSIGTLMVGTLPVYMLSVGTFTVGMVWVVTAMYIGNPISCASRLLYVWFGRYVEGAPASLLVASSELQDIWYEGARM